MSINRYKPQVDPVERDLKKHIEALGLKTSADYIRWCKNNGFGTGLYKTEAMRKKELDLVKKQNFDAIVEKNKDRHKPFAKKIEDLITNPKIKSDEVKDPFLKEIIAVSFKDEAEKLEFFKFLNFLSKKSKLVTPEYLKSLLEVFKRKHLWISSYLDWESPTKNINRQFSHLLRFLFTKYKIPDFLDDAWFWKGSSLYTQDIELFLWIAQGHNVRKFPGLKIELSKKQAHEFLNAPSNYTIIQALRYGQIIGMGGDKRLVQAISETQLGREFKNEDFWLSVLNFFVLNPMLDRHQVGPIIDYLNFQKFSINAPSPGLSMKGRNPETLLAQVEGWHRSLRKAQGKNFKEWPACGISEFNKEEKLGDKSRFWNVIELKNSKELEQEGRAQKHCVSSYSSSCLAKRCAIYSIRLDGERMGTIEVIPNTRSIVQARGKCNALLSGRTWSILQEWAANARLNIACSHG